MKKKYDKAAICKAAGTITGLIIVLIKLNGFDFTSIYGLTNISTFALLGYFAGNIFYAFINIANEASKDLYKDFWYPTNFYWYN